MYRVRTLSDREKLLQIKEQAEKLALTPNNKQWKKHRKIAQSIADTISGMIIFEDYTVTPGGTLRKTKRQTREKRRGEK